MTKKALIREYITAIERLKSDLAASREKNGIFLSPESYASLVEESQSRKDRIDEVQADIDCKAAEMEKLEGEFKIKMALLDKTTADLNTTMAELYTSQQGLKLAMEESEELGVKLREQVYISGAHAETESHLSSLTAGLLSTLKLSVGDLEGLHSKLDRKTALEIQNRHIFDEFTQRIAEAFKKCEEAVGNLAGNSDAVMNQVKSLLEGLSENVNKVHFDLRSYLNHILSSLLHIKQKANM